MHPFIPVLPPSMHSLISNMRPPPSNIVGSTPTKPSPQSQPRPHDRASSPPPQRPKKRSSDEAGNDTSEIRTTKRHSCLSSLYFPNTTLTPNPRPSQKLHTNQQPIPPPLYQESKNTPLYQQSFQISPIQQHTFEHIPPSQQLVDATTYLSQPKPNALLPAPPPILGTKRAWSDAARDGAWGFYDCAAPVRKKARIEEVFIVDR